VADRLDFEIDVELETGLITGHAGVPGLIEAFRQTGTAAVIDREVKLKSRRRGLSASAMVESLLAMWAAGGERTEDLDQFRQDKALAMLLGHELPAAQTARDFLAQFHAEDLPLLQDGKAPVAAETAPLQGLAKANAELVLDLQCRRPAKIDISSRKTARSVRRAAFGLPNPGAGAARALALPDPAALVALQRARAVGPLAAALHDDPDGPFRGDPALHGDQAAAFINDIAVGDLHAVAVGGVA